MKMQTRLARMESQVDYLETEITSLNQLLKAVGFSEGITTLRETAQILLDERKNLYRT